MALLCIGFTAQLAGALETGASEFIQQVGIVGKIKAPVTCFCKLVVDDTFEAFNRIIQITVFMVDTGAEPGQGPRWSRR